MIDPFDQTALLTAVKLNKPLICEYLVVLGRASADQDFLDHTDAQGWTALRYSAWAGNEDIVRVLLEHGASVDLSDSDGRTALRAACFGGHVHVVELLLSYGADSKLIRNFLFDEAIGSKLNITNSQFKIQFRKVKKTDSQSYFTVFTKLFYLYFTPPEINKFFHKSILYGLNVIL